jgi:UDP-N-acetylglucosamine 3-dehydrogenase
MFLVNYLTQELYFYENVVAPTEWHPLSVLTGVGEGNMTRFQFPRYEPLKAELEDFVGAVSNGEAPLVSGVDGMKALHLAQALVESGKKGKVISL